MRRNPYYGLPGDPYGGEELIPSDASVLNGRPVGPSGRPLPGYEQQEPPYGQVIDQYGRMQMEPRTFGAHSENVPPAPMSMAMVTTPQNNAPSVTGADGRIAAQWTQPTQRQHGIDAGDVVTAAAIGVAVYSTVSWWDRLTKKQRATATPFLWGMVLAPVVWGIAVAISFLAVFAAPDVDVLATHDPADAAANTFASILIYGGGILILVMLGLWIGMHVAVGRVKDVGVIRAEYDSPITENDLINQNLAAWRYRELPR